MKNIGIYGWSTGENSFGVTKPYLDFIRRFDAVPKILTPDNIFDESIDMLLLPGGMDINPTSYGEIPGYFTSSTDVFKQHVYDTCLPKYVEAGKTIFGICLGFQQIASYFGCKLTQNLPYHEQSKERFKDAHDVRVENSLFFWEQKNKQTFKVNSMHHQGLLRQDVNIEQLTILLSAQNEQWEKGHSFLDIVEGIKHNELPIFGVQSHPEEIYTPYVYDLFDYALHIND